MTADMTADMTAGTSSPPAELPRRGPAIGLVIGLVIAISMIGCIVHPLSGPRLTGTCEGACAHYVQCKPGHRDVDRNQCALECPEVLSDRDSLMAYESLACDDAVEYIDGQAAKTAAHR
jgi:hypothetical protein